MCRFRKESSGLKLFSQYSQNACQFECQIEIATAKCGCVPWDYPHVSKKGLLQVCEGWGRYCFESVFKNPKNRKNHCGHCLPDCIITRYVIENNKFCLRTIANTFLGCKQIYIFPNQTVFLGIHTRYHIL